MKNVLKIEWLKTRNTLIRPIVFFTPILIALVQIIAISRRRYLNAEKDIFLIRTIFFEVYIPLIVSFISSYMVGYEEFYGNINGLLSLKTKRTNIYLAKFIMVNLMLLFMIVLENIAFAMGLKVLNMKFSITFLLCSTVILFVGIIPLIAIHIFLSFICGMGLSILIGFIGMLISTLINNGLGEEIWYMIPWAIPLRIFMYLYLLVFNNNVKISQEQAEFVATHSHTNLFLIFSWKGFLAGILILSAFILVGIKWFNNWEGREISN